MPRRPKESHNPCDKRQAQKSHRLCDYQQLLAPVELIVWLDSSEEAADRLGLEDRIRHALLNPAGIIRFGGLSLGESTHLVDEVQPLERFLQSRRYQRLASVPSGQAFLLAERGRLTLPVWVDHVGSAGTRHVTGDLRRDWPIDRAPEREQMSRIEPPEDQGR
jgi:CRISPR-associated protein Cas5t